MFFPYWWAYEKRLKEQMQGNMGTISMQPPEQLFCCCSWFFFFFSPANLFTPVAPILNILLMALYLPSLHSLSYNLFYLLHWACNCPWIHGENSLHPIWRILMWIFVWSIVLLSRSEAHLEFPILISLAFCTLSSSPSWFAIKISYFMNKRWGPVTNWTKVDITNAWWGRWKYRNVFETDRFCPNVVKAVRYLVLKWQVMCTLFLQDD